MARIAIVANVAEDLVARLEAPLKTGAHQPGAWDGGRLGGGAANTGIPLVRAGHRVAVVSTIGSDAMGGRLIGQLAKAGLDVSLIRTLPGETTRALILLDPSGERTIVNLAGAADPDPPDWLLHMDVAWVYVKSRALNLASVLSEAAKTAQVVAHVPPTAEGSRPAHILLGSRSDLGDAFLADPRAAGRKIAGKPLQWVVITDGAAGATAYGLADKAEIKVKARAVKPVDTTGAGDAFAAGLIHGLASGQAMEQALELAADWGTRATLSLGSVPSDIP